MNPEVIYPVDMGEYEWWETGSKGWLQVTVRWDAAEWAITFYDPVRLSQEINLDLARQGYFAERIIVVPSLTREAVEAAVQAIAQHDGFADFS
ncbi:hypothetical protein GCM10010112_63170 [Actinoplanes lobatus]|uniref:Uncharacterized protein n=2 Tax=Actinoplanes lobatus TaxID=113568 RepID=A0ABQ4ASW0_9ACTN|nr:hypothetical protein [Actinoplanes lobatus]GGN84139.1 hypothetical protein GCM10010112_63170 [Actinoplanes lobatus]GIE44095.1 hypothetical protein Alo02nite_69930 [Actinoplanes lobatus]